MSSTNDKKTESKLVRRLAVKFSDYSIKKILEQIINLDGLNI